MARLWQRWRPSSCFTGRNSIHDWGSPCAGGSCRIEKYSKALLTLLEIEYPQTHSVDILVSLIPPKSRPNLTPDEQDRLTEYATVTRYAGGYEPIPLTEAEEAVDTARRFRESIRLHLPTGGVVSTF